MKLPAHKKMLSAAAAASVMLLTAACGSGSDDASDPPSSSASPSASSDDSADASTATYKDGDYEAKASYANPAGSSDLEVKLTLAGNKVTAVDVTPEATDGTSKGFQEMFASGIAGEVVGKSLDGLKVDKVAGSSLTHLGFNKAIDEIKADAKA